MINSKYIFISDEESVLAKDPSMPTMTNVIVAKSDEFVETDDNMVHAIDDQSVDTNSNNGRRMSIMSSPNLICKIVDNRMQVRVSKETYTNHFTKENGFVIELTKYLIITIKLINSLNMIEPLQYGSSSKSLKWNNVRGQEDSKSPSSFMIGMNKPQK